MSLVEERQRRGCTERIVQATARSYVIDPGVVGDRLQARPGANTPLSSRYLIALAARMVSEVSTLTREADAAGKELATLAIDTDLRFASADQRASFTAELAEAIRDLAARYHDESAPDGRWHRLVIGAHTRPGGDDRPPTTDEPSEESSR